MSQAPTPYTRQNNFTSDALNPSLTLADTCGDLDAEYEAIKTSLNETISRLNEIQRDDGLLRQGIFDPADQEKLSALDNAAASAVSASQSEASAAQSSAEASASAASAAASASDAATSATSAETSAQDAAAIYDYFDDRYLGAKPNDPIVDNDGNPLVSGTIYFNTSLNEFRVWNGVGWQEALSGVFVNVNTINSFSGNGVQTVFSLTSPGSQYDTAVYIDGVYQANSSYVVSGLTLTFSAAPPSGSAIEVQINAADTIPDDSIPNAATTAESANVADTIVLRDGSGNFSAGTITANLSGNATSATSATTATTATSADQLTTARKINNELFDGTSDVRVITNGPVFPTTAGSSITFSAIPAGVNRVTVMVNGVSQDNVAALQLRLGSGGIPQPAGYNGTVSISSSYSTNQTSFELTMNVAASYFVYGQVILNRIAPNTWVATSNMSPQQTDTSGMACHVMGGSVTLGGDLDVVEFFTTALFDAGEVSISYE